MSTKIADVTVPEVFLPYLRTQMLRKNALIRSGIVVPDPRYDELARKGGTTINMPYWNDLSGDDEILSDSRALTPGKITSDKDVARLHMRGRAWGSNDLAAALSGDDPMGAVVDRVANYWIAREQSLLVNTLNGVFAGTNMDEHVLNLAIEDGANAAAENTISGNSIIDAFTILGDQAERLTAICMHSAVYANLQKQNLIEYVEHSDAKIKIPYYMGREVLVDDSMPSEDGTTSGKKYTTYLFGKGAIALGEGAAPTPLEHDRDSLAGEDILINRRHFILHPKGVRWMEADCAEDAPSNIECANGANWKRVYEKKNVRLVKMITNG